jgi:hypothetical protein
MAQYGTNGGVYLGCDGAVFYRNNTHLNWKPYSTGLPVSAETNRLKPFYRDGKIRNGCWGFGVWESPLFETSTIIAQPMASALVSNCTRDTVYFDDYSVLNHTGATWAWSFSPTPAYVSATNVRNPKVLFGAVGTYTATLTVNGTYSKSLSISVTNGCQADTIPGNMVTLGGNTAEDYVSIPALNLNTNTMTVSAWIKIDGIQPDYSSIFMLDATAAGFHFQPGNNHLGYHWPSGAWWWDSGLAVPDKVWAHIAMVVESTGVTLYLNGIKSKHSFTVPLVNFSSISRLGNYRGWGGRFMKGSIDEVCIFNNSLTQNDIRDLMHHTKVPANMPNLIAYYQFNEASGEALDRVGLRHASLVNGATRAVSTGPFGKGVTARLNVNSTGLKTFAGTGVQMNFPTTFPNNEVMVSRINQPPYLPPNPAQQLTSGGYWIIHNYGQNNIPANIIFAPGKGVYAPDSPNLFSLSRRDSTSDISNWVTADAAGDVITGNTLTFSTNLSFQFGRQYAITDAKGIKLNMKVMLEGPYNTTTTKMNDNLRLSALIPSLEPFTNLSFTHKNGGGGETVLPAIWAVSTDNAIVDWIFVELRHKTNPTNILYTRAALVQKDGDVVDTDGVSPLYFNQASPNDYYIAIRHRNHFGFRTAGFYNLTATPTVLNFTSTTTPVALYGINPLKTIGTTRVLYAGDANRDGTVNAIDRNAYWRIQNGGTFNYLNTTADFNLDGTINAVDRNAFWRLNNSLVQQLD